MTAYPPQNNEKSSLNQCYCLNPNCQHPVNPRTALVCESCGQQLLLQKRYRAIAPIGQGGFGRTFRALDEAQPSQPPCAIKQFFLQYPRLNNTQKATELFRQEAKKLEELGTHPRIPKLLAYFEEENGQYLVQEFIDGANLAQELTEKGAFSEPEIRQLLINLLSVLKFLHKYQLIHRDIKPENIIRRRPNLQLILVDFGAAKYITETVLGKTGTVIGSAAYIPPEQTRGKAIFASDIYSLGVTCIHLLTNVPPFDLFDTSENAWVWRQYLKKPISKQLGNILDKMLESGTNRRYQSADEVLKDLNEITSTAAPKRSYKKWWLTGTVLFLGFTAFRNFTTPPAPQPTYSPPTTYYEEVQPTPTPAIAVPKNSGLNAIVNGEEKSFPLEHTEVMAKVSGNISRVEVTQTFTNPFTDPLEAVYVFPLPDESAVDDMEIKVGDRIIRSVIKKREEAKQIYEQAKQEGKTTALLEQERDNIFTQSLANIKPGEEIEVTIRYTESLKFEKGDYEFVFPMAVAARYTGGSSQVTDAAKISPPMTTGKTGHEIGVTVEIEAGLPISDVRSPSHEIRTTKEGRILRVQLQNSEEIPDKDLIVRYRVAGNDTQSTVLTQGDERGGHFATYLIPAVEYQSNEIVPKDVVFLIDTSGSQSGSPMTQSKDLMRRFINGLNPNDTFTIVDFANSARQLSGRPLENTLKNRKKALKYIDRLEANGGTELYNGIQTVLNFPEPEEGRLRSIVLITDGLIGDENAILAEVEQKLNPGNRLYSFGVGDSVNRFFIDRLAEIGRGTAVVLTPYEPSEKVVEQFFQNLNNPILTNMEVSWEGSGTPPSIYPQRLPDLFANQPLVLYGRKGDRASGKLRITGIAVGGKRYEKVLPVNFSGNAGSAMPQGNEAIAQLWGRAQIKAFMDRMYNGTTPEGIEGITKTAIAYRLMSQYTSFVAVTEEVRVDPNGKQVRVQVPVSAPEGTEPESPTYSGGGYHAVPEPSVILGNIFAAIVLWMFFLRKRGKLNEGK